MESFLPAVFRFLRTLTGVLDYHFIFSEPLLYITFFSSYGLRYGIKDGLKAKYTDLIAKYTDLEISYTVTYNLAYLQNDLP
jgi:hypothetical protein